MSISLSLTLKVDDDSWAVSIARGRLSVIPSRHINFIHARID